MPVSKEQFDADLAAHIQGDNDLIAAQTTYIAAVDAFIALPPIIDLSNEDSTVQAGLAAVQAAKGAVTDAQGRIPPPPPTA